MKDQNGSHAPADGIDSVATNGLSPAKRHTKGRPVGSSGEAVSSEYLERVSLRHRQAARIEAESVTDLYAQVQHIADTIPHYGQDMELKALYQSVGMRENRSDWSVAIRVNNAFYLKTTFLPVFKHLEAGNFSYQIAVVIPEQGKNITDPEALNEYLRIVLSEALKPGMTVSRLRKFAKEIAATLTDQTIEDAHASVIDEYLHGGVKFIELEHSLVEIRIIMNAVDAMAVKDRVKRVAHVKKVAQREARAAWEKENMGRTVLDGVSPHGPEIDNIAILEHETATELLTGNLDPEHQSVKAEIRVTVPLLSLERGTSRHTVEELQQRVGTIAGLSGNAHLEGFGPVPIQSIQDLCANQREWLRMFIDPDSGVVMATDKRQPSTALKRFLRFRDPTCRWPGCNTSADRCDIDHTIPWSKIHDTSPSNTAHLCRRHHVLKHNAGRTLCQMGDGVLKWTLPNGETYIDHPYRVPSQRPVGVKGRGVFFSASPPF